MHDDQNEIELLIEVTPARVQDAPIYAERGWSDDSRGVTSRVVRGAANEAVNAAFGVIEHIARKTAQFIVNMQNADGRPMPTSLDIEFGVSFNGELQAYIAKASAEGAISVKLSWTLKQPAG
jgi:hypothetical protein